MTNDPDIRGYTCPAEWALLLVTDDGVATVLAIADTSEVLNQMWDVVDKTAPRGMLMAKRLRRSCFEFADETATSWMSARAPILYSPNSAAEQSA